MKNFYTRLLNLTFTTLAIFLLSSAGRVQAQACSTAQGNQTTYGTNNTWIGYVYTGQNFNNYQGYVTEGSAGSPNFNEGFGGGGVTYNTNGCSITTDNFSVRYKLTQTFASGNYSITIGGDDGVRLSLDGGNTWVINMWQDQSYTTSTYTVALSGSYNMVLEYYQNGGANQVSFNITAICTGTGDPTVYGTNNVWMGYLYQGMAFQLYKGTVTEGSASNPSFDENFGNPGGSNTNTFNTNSCSVTTFQFSARYRLTQTLSAGTYTFTAGGDDGFRLSLDGGNTWVINKWEDQGYTTSSYTTTLSAGSYPTVLEYYDNGGSDRVTYSNTFSTLPVTVTNWSASLQTGDKALLKWTASDAINFDHFIVQCSTDGESFEDVGTVAAIPVDSSAAQAYSYTDQFTYNGNVYYRLELVDVNGNNSYSTVVSLPMKATVSTAIRIYPTVVESGQLFVESATAISEAQLEIFDMNGQRLQVNDWSILEGRQQVAINGNKGRLPAGAYIARLTNGQSLLAKQIIIIK
jgi:PA14 domain